MPQNIEIADDWASALRQRRAALLQRMAVGTAAGLAFSPLIGWVYGMAWLSGYFAIQAIDLWMFRPIYSGATARMGPMRSAIGAALLFFNTAFYGSLSILLWFKDGPIGGVCAVIMLAGGAIYSTVNAPRSMRVLACTVAPHMIYLTATPLFLALSGASGAYVTASAAAALVFSVYCLNAWQRMNMVRRAEQHARAELERRRVETERVMAGRNAFVAAVGHDLRTPIGAILTGAAELERGAVDASARSHAALIADAGMMMKALLDDLLDHAKLDAGRMTVEAADFNLREMLAHTMRLWLGPARAKGLRLRVEGAASMPTWVRGDAVRVRQVLNNLISNAMKFTEAGAITLRLESWPDELGDHAVLIQVIDTGPGMTRAQQQRLFSPFDQTADGVSARHGGTGLGLAISRDLAHLMGGRLTARSAPGEGAVFTLALTLPRGEGSGVAPDVLDEGARSAVARALSGLRPEAAVIAPGASQPASQPVAQPQPQPQPAPVVDAAPEADADGEEDSRPLRVLVVDDHDINRRAIQLILAPLGCDIATAADGMAALSLCDANDYDVIFMDVRMPELDGRETTRRLRAQGGPNARTPVIAVTADSAPEDVAACMAAGMTYFVSKPLTPQVLLGALSAVLEDAEEAPAEEVAAVA